MQNSYKLHYCTDLPIQYRYKKIKSVITALSLDVKDVPRQTFADLRQLSPIPTLPLLETSQGNITSSNTIIRYLATVAGYKLYGGQNLYQRALIDQWLDLVVCDFDTCAIAVNVFIQGKQVDIEAVTQDAEKFLTHLNKHLKNRKFIVGESLTIADLAIAATVGPVLAHMYGEQERKKYGILSTWYHGITQQNKQIQPKQLPKKIHKKFQKKHPKQQQKDGKQQKGKEKAKQKGEKGQKGKVQEKQGQGKDKKQKKDKKDKKDKNKQQKKQTQAKKQEKKPEGDLFDDQPTAAAPTGEPQKKPEPKKQAKKKPAAKSIVVFNVKVYDQQQDLNALADKIKKQIQMDGLVWNNEVQIKPVAFGMNMLQIGCVIQDSKVSVEQDIYTVILGWETEVQSVDTVTFQKL